MVAEVAVVAEEEVAVGVGRRRQRSEDNMERVNNIFKDAFEDPKKIIKCMNAGVLKL